MVTFDLGQALRAAFGADPGSVPDVVVRIAAGFGATDVVAYLVDFAQESLEALPTGTSGAELPPSEDVTATMAGRAFMNAAPEIVDRDGAQRVWVPIIEGSDRTGVLAVTVPEATGEIVRLCEELGLFAGYLIATHTRSTDLYQRHRKRRSLSVAASMQWDLLPPLVLKTSRLSVAGLLEPAYEVGGDCFDYAINDDVFDLAVFDPVGHGMRSALIAAMCVGSYRHGRRDNCGLEQIHETLDEAVTREFTDTTFATGQLARVELDTGALSWTNAGHPLPMLVRGGQVIKELSCAPTPPWGMGGLSSGKVTVATEALEPGDSVLFYTDGVVEAHLPGTEQFGSDRLADLVGQQAGSEAAPEEVLRRIVRAVLEHQDDQLADDATIVIFSWHGSP